MRLLMLMAMLMAGCASQPLTYEQRVGLMGVAAGLQHGADLYAAGARPAPYVYQPVYVQQPSVMQIPPATVAPMIPTQRY